MPCSICKNSGHVKTTCTLKNRVDKITIKKNIIKPTAKAVKDDDTKYDTDNDETIETNSNTENFDTEELDTEKSNTEKSDTDESDTDESDTDESDTDESDTEESDTDKSDTDKSDTEEENILSSTFWKNTKAYKLICEKETQIKYYKKNNSSVEVLQLVDLDPWRFKTPD